VRCFVVAGFLLTSASCGPSAIAELLVLAIVVEKVQTHQHANFRQNRSIGCKDIKIFRFFNMAAIAILGYRNREFLFTDGIWRAQLHHCTKFCQNRSLHCGDTAIFGIFKMAAAAILDF